jgi:hypothetical protein
LFKVLLAASLAMFACCVAAAWAGPVEPALSGSRSVLVSHEPAPAAQRAPAPVIRKDAAWAEPSLLDTVVVEGFVPVTLSATYEGAARPNPAAEEDVAPLGPQGQQPAVIPLPHPLYAAAVLLVLVILARRAIIRTCHA